MCLKEITLLLLCLCFRLSSQVPQASLEWGPETDIKSENRQFIVSADENTAYILDIKHNEYGYYNNFYITKLVGLKPQGEKKEVQIPKIDGVFVNFKDFLIIDGKLTLLTYLVNAEQKTRTLYAYDFYQDLSLNSKANIVGTVKNVGKKDYGYSKDFLTADKKTLCLVRRTPGDSTSFGFTASDKNHTILFDFDITVPGNKYGSIETYTMLPDGNVYFAVKVEKSKAEKKKDMPKNYYLLYKYDALNKKTILTKLDLDSNYILGVKFALDESGNFICGGTYSKYDYFNRKNANEFLSGFFAVTCDKTSGNVLSREIKGLNNNDVSPNRFSLAFWDYKLEHVITLSDGNIMFIAEQQGYFASGGSLYQSGNSIIIGMLNLKTHFFDHFEISKEQTKGDDDYTYLLFIDKNKVDIVLNADEELLEKTKAEGAPKYLNYHSKSVIFYHFNIDNRYKINANRVRTTNIGPGYKLVRSTYTKVNDNTYIISAISEDEKYRFAKIILK